MGGCKKTRGYDAKVNNVMHEMKESRDDTELRGKI